MLNKILKVLLIITLILTAISLFYNLTRTFFFNMEINPIGIFSCFAYCFIFLVCVVIIKRRIMKMNSSLIYLFLIFTFSALVLGRSLEFYETLFFWDDLLHFLSGILVSLLMFNILFSVSGEDQINKYPKLVIFVFIMGSTVTIGVIWEIFEFFMDTFINLNLQSTFIYDSTTNFMDYVNDANRFVAPSLVDTMLDIITEFSTSLITTSIIVLYGPVKFYNKFLNKKNPAE